MHRVWLSSCRIKQATWPLISDTRGEFVTFQSFSWEITIPLGDSIKVWLCLPPGLLSSCFLPSLGRRRTFLLLFFQPPLLSIGSFERESDWRREAAAYPASSGPRRSRGGKTCLLEIKTFHVWEGEFTRADHALYKTDSPHSLSDTIVNYPYVYWC